MTMIGRTVSQLLSCLSVWVYFRVNRVQVSFILMKIFVFIWPFVAARSNVNSLWSLLVLSVISSLKSRQCLRLANWFHSQDSRRWGNEHKGEVQSSISNLLEAKIISCKHRPMKPSPSSRNFAPFFKF